jgi:uncharacterized protein
LPNRLANETSPYLLQHAHNPVDWFPWGDEAIRKSREEDKPMLVSIGYSACHWCHVMERESFEDPETAEIMNRLFVNIKIDREERPDLDHIYMEAVQAIAGNGGWPLNVFLTPEGKPFYGGTYFPPRSLQNRPSWKSVLQTIATAFQEKRKEIEEQADHLTNHIAGPGFGIQMNAGDGLPTKDEVREMYEQLMKTADRKEGGFGVAPKFPQTFSIRLLLQYHYYTGETDALKQAELSLEKMIKGGIYDQLAGGFARYSTDEEWLAPHFEKMLYDNALLIIAMSEAFQLTQKTLYSRAIRETMDFIQNELSSEKGAFYSALDADSEGVEGKFYTWQKNEILEIIGEEGEDFCTIYDVSEEGNWEGKNILRLTTDPLSPAKAGFGGQSGQRSRVNEMEVQKKKLLSVRNQRIRPQLDDKILLGWNALMITACCKAFAALGEEKYRDLALRNMMFLEENMQGEGINRFYHGCKEIPNVTEGHEGGVKVKAAIPAFLDDYAYLIEAYIQLQEVTGDATWLIHAKALADWVIAHFSEAETGYFYYTHDEQNDVIVRKREVYDGALPSGNAVMASNLLYLGTVFDLEEWKQRALRNVMGLKDVMKRYPGSFGVWATLVNAFTYPLYEIVLAGSYSEKNHLEFLQKSTPNRVFQVSSVTHPGLPILRNKPVQGQSQFFLCRDYSCQQPVKEVSELIRLIKNS